VDVEPLLPRDRVIDFDRTTPLATCALRSNSRSALTM
jgi:hypothetical protein